MFVLRILTSRLCVFVSDLSENGHNLEIYGKTGNVHTKIKNAAFLIGFVICSYNGLACPLRSSSYLTLNSSHRKIKL